MVESCSGTWWTYVTCQILPYSARAVESTNHDFPSLGWKIAIGLLSTSALAALKIWLTASLEHRLEGSSEGTSGGFLCIFFYILWFYWSKYRGCTQVVSFFKYCQCIITAPVVPATCLCGWYTRYMFMRSVHQPLLTHWCTNHCLQSTD